MDFGAATVAGVGDEAPVRRRAGVEVHEVLEIERGDEAVGVDPDAGALDEDVAVHGHGCVEIRGEDAVVFGFHRAEIDGQAGHAAAAVGEQHQRGFERRGGNFFAVKTGASRSGGSVR